MKSASRESRRDLLSGVFGTEIDWKHVPPVLRSWRLGEVSFVYFVGEVDGPIKVGHARDPVKRLRQLQTGNPRRLKIERLIYGGPSLERLLHEIWRAFVIGGNPRRSELNPQYRVETEWFRAEVRDRILDAATEIAAQQVTEMPEDWEDVAQQVVTALGYEIRRGDTVRRLASGPGYVEQRLRP